MPNPLRPNKPGDALTQLNNALTQIKSANALLDSVLAGWVVPDAPDQPPYVDALNNIQALARHSLDVASQLLTTMGR